MKKQTEYNLKGLMNYKSAFQLMQIVFFIIVVVFLVIVGIIYFNSQKRIASLQNSIYVIDKTGAIASANRMQQTKDTRLFEYKDQVKSFFQLWYQLDPASYNGNINNALKLIGKSGKVLYAQYLDAEIEKKLITNGITTKSYVDSIKFDTSTLPVKGIVYGRQDIIRKNVTTKRMMVCTFTITDINRSEDNSHGALIDNWNVINNKIINKNE